MLLQDYRGRSRLLQDEVKFLKDEGAAAVLIASEKWFGMMNMGTGMSRQYQPAPLPNAYMSRESATLLWRLLDARSVEVKINRQGKLTRKSEMDYNTVAEIKRTQKPHEA